VTVIHPSIYLPSEKEDQQQHQEQQNTYPLRTVFARSSEDTKHPFPQFVEAVSKWQLTTGRFLPGPPSSIKISHFATKSSWREYETRRFA
jgi:hypothetical protein